VNVTRILTTTRHQILRLGKKWLRGLWQGCKPVILKTRVVCKRSERLKIFMFANVITSTASILGCSVCMASHKVCFVISSVHWITWHTNKLAELSG
jgi:hypothetical protein